MKRKNKLILTVLGLTLSTQLLANDVKISETELKVFTAQKFKIDFDKQNDETKTKIKNEFEKNAKFADKLISTNMKSDIDFKIASRQIAIDIWVQKFIRDVKVDDKILKDLFKKYKPKKAATYKLRNILVSTENRADKIITILSKYKNKKSHLKKFIDLVGYNSFDEQTAKNEGKIGWISVNKLDPKVKEALVKAKSNLVKVQIKDRSWQVLLIEDSTKERVATFEESKNELLLVAKQELLKKEIDKIINK
ncbi:MAG: peptidylprolyl isomerase [Poseidonibacter sp.]